MAPRGLRSRTTKLRAVRGASIVAISCLALPAFANAPKIIPCPDTIKANLDIPASELNTHSVAHEVSLATLDDIAASTVEAVVAPSELLSPLAEDAIRAAFAGDDEANITDQVIPLMTPIVNSNDVVESNESTPTETGTRSSSREMHTRLPGISDDELSRHKKQMFRRDI